MASSIYDIGEPGTIAWAEFKLRSEGSVSGEDLALVLERNPDLSLPPKLREHLIQQLRGEIKPKKGRRPVQEDPTDIQVVAAFYRMKHQELLDLETARRANGKRKARTSSSTLSASDDAIEYAKRYSPRTRTMTNEAVRNLLSSRKLL
jgi:hypothetical protein